MKKNRFQKYIVNIPITGKIALGFVTFISIIFILALLVNRNIKQDHENLGKIAKLSVNTSEILNINRQISDIQRLANVYGLTGSSSVIDRMQSSFSELSQSLMEVEKTTESKKRIELISDLKMLLDEYGKNIESLESMYKYRSTLLSVTMPTLQRSGLQFLEEKIKSSQRNRNLKAIIAYQSMLQDWYKMSAVAGEYLEKKDFKYKAMFFRIEKSLYQAISSSVRLSTDEKQQFKEKLAGFREAFEKSVLANRNYLSLVNVVMTGAAIEFTTISDQLRTSSLDELDELLLNSDKLLSLNKKILIIFFVGSLPLLFLLGLYYQFSIANRLKEISNVFRKFIEGDLDHVIREKNRHDEIGQLSNAAHEFRNVIKKMKEEELKAKKSLEVKSRFLATMSHEIRTPMNAVLSCTDLLVDETKKPEHLSLLQTIRKSGDSLLVLIDDILDFSKIETGKLSIDKAEIDVRLITGEVMNLLSSGASSKGVKLELKVDENVPQIILSDSNRIKQLLINLIGNGIKFSKDKVSVKVSAVKGRGKNYTLAFTVSDNGIGISQDDQALLFKEFSQVDPSTTRKFGGTGLGLAICNGIITAMGGSISVKSKVGAGSHFTFKFSAEQSVTNLAEEKETVVSPIKRYSGPVQILLAEDNKINRMVAKKIIDKLGYAIDMVINGVEATEAIKTKKYQLIFMDQHMPEMDGLEATRVIRSMKEIKQPKIYALTASAFEDDRQRCLAAGMDGFLTKPISGKKLLEAIEESLG